MFRDPNPNVSSYESHPASGQLATHSGRNDETDPTNDKISLHIFLSNDGSVQKPLEPLQQGQRISMQPSKFFFFFFPFVMIRCPPRDRAVAGSILVTRPNNVETTTLDLIHNQGPLPLGQTTLENLQHQQCRLHQSQHQGRKHLID
jgi:hypothetical protein